MQANTGVRYQQVHAHSSSLGPPQLSHLLYLGINPLQDHDVHIVGLCAIQDRLTAFVLIWLLL